MEKQGEEHAQKKQLRWARRFSAAAGRAGNAGVFVCPSLLAFPLRCLMDERLVGARPRSLRRMRTIILHRQELTGITFAEFLKAYLNSQERFGIFISVICPGWIGIGIGIPGVVFFNPGHWVTPHLCACNSVIAFVLEHLYRRHLLEILFFSSNVIVRVWVCAVSSSVRKSPRITIRAVSLDSCAATIISWRRLNLVLEIKWACLRPARSPLCVSVTSTRWCLRPEIITWGNKQEQQTAPEGHSLVWKCKKHW